MGVVFAGFTNDFPVKLVLDTTFNQHGNCFGTLVADYLASHGTLEGCFRFRHL
jgi:hypothetical protein